MAGPLGSSPRTWPPQAWHGLPGGSLVLKMGLEVLLCFLDPGPCSILTLR